MEDRNKNMTEEAADEMLVKKAMDRLEPSDELKSSMWDRIEAAAAESGSQAETAGKTEKITVKKKSHKGFVRKFTAVAAALLLLVGGSTWLAGRNDVSEIPDLSGNVYASESRVTDMTAEQVLVSAGDPKDAGEIYVYAPKIYYLDDERIVFGNASGLIIYDLSENKVSGLIDMQAICSGYYNSNTMNTHVLVEGDELTVYNTKGRDDMNSGDEEATGAQEEPFGYYHVFDISKMPEDGGLLTCKKSGDDKEFIVKLMKKGAAFEKAVYEDAWDNIKYLQGKEMSDLIGTDTGTYSELAYIADTKGGRTENVILSRGNGYELLRCKGGDEIDAEKLDLGITDEVRSKVKKLNSLPEYKYSGDDDALKVICDKLASDEESWYGDTGDGGVNIPAPVIFGKKQKDDELLVFGNFWLERYIRRGNTLICISGGEQPACYHLKKGSDGYEVASVDVAEDGDSYADSIRKFTKGYPEMTEKFLKHDSDEERNRERIKAIKSYVDANGIGIRYVKEYGWDPIAID